MLAQNLDAIQNLAGIPLQYTGSTLGQLITNALPYVFGAAAILLLIYLVTAGLGMMLAKGDPKAIQAAQTKITHALIGFVIVFFAFALVSLIGSILGVSIFDTIF